MAKKLKAGEFWGMMEQVGVKKGDYKMLAMYIESMYWHWENADRERGCEFLADVWKWRCNYLSDELHKKGLY